MSTGANITIDIQSSYLNGFRTWESPSLADLDFSNCDAVSAFWGEFVNLIQHNSTGLNTTVGNLGKFANYLETSVPRDWPPAPHLSYLVIWYYNTWLSPSIRGGEEWTTFNENLDQSLYSDCLPELCNALDVAGDPDVSGAGMMGSYYVAAALSTVYFLVLVLFGNRRVSTTKKDGPGINYIMSAFRDSVGSFLDAALIFTASMLVSAVARYTSFIRHRNAGDLDPNNFSLYQLIGAVAMSVYCVFPCLVLQTVAGDLRFRWLRLFLWTVVFALTIVVEVQYRDVYGLLRRDLSNSSIVGRYDGPPGLFREALWLSLCDDSGLFDRIKHSVTAGHAILGIECVWLFYYIVVNIYLALDKGAALERMKERTMFGVTVKRWFTLVRWINGVMCGIQMWIMLVLFNLYRNYLRRTSQANEDGEWSFGQVLSLFTWVSVVLEWGAISIIGPKKGQEQKVSPGWELQPTGEDSRA